MHNRIQDMRKSKKMSLQDLADKSHISKAHIWELEQDGKTNPTLSTVLKLCESLDVSLNWLVLGGTWADSPRDLLIQRYEEMEEKDKKTKRQFVILPSFL